MVSPRLNPTPRNEITAHHISYGGLDVFVSTEENELSNLNFRRND